jgi:hypothetical protein
MADKTVLLNGRTLVHGQGVKETIETSTSKNVCFDEVVTQGSPSVSYKVDIDRLVYETRDDYENLNADLKSLLSVPGYLTTREVIRYDNEHPFVIVKNYSGVILDSKDYEMKPEEHSAQKLSFICASLDEYTEPVQE